MSGKGRLLRGAPAIAGVVFGDKRKARSVYGIAHELPLFWLGGVMAGYEQALHEAMAQKERVGLRRRRRRAA